MSDPLASFEEALRPYRGELQTFTCLPEQGRARADVLAELEAMATEERPKWEQGYASGAVYAGEPEHVEFLNSAYALHSQSNPLHLDLWPSAAKFEGEIVAMTAGMLGAGETGDDASGRSRAAAPSRSSWRCAHTGTGRGTSAGSRRPRW